MLTSGCHLTKQMQISTSFHQALPRTHVTLTVVLARLPTQDLKLGQDVCPQALTPEEARSGSRKETRGADDTKGHVSPSQPKKACILNPGA